MPDAPLSGLVILPVPGIGEIRPGADLVAEIHRAAPWLNSGDVVVVTSKIVSKAEGCLIAVSADPDEREQARLAAVDAETEQVVARRGRTTISRTRLGIVLAAAGVDTSNVDRSEIALLPVDPDASAAGIREGLRRSAGVEVAVIISDTMGRAWRTGQTDCAIGVAGINALRDERGAVDRHGNALSVTEIALADELAGAAELVKGKLGDVPVAVVRGLSYRDEGGGSAPLIRPVDQDMFALGAREAAVAAVTSRRTAENFTDEVVAAQVVERALRAASSAPGAEHCRLVVEGRGPVRIEVHLRPRIGDPASSSAEEFIAVGALVQSILVTASADGLATSWQPVTWPEHGDDEPSRVGTVLIGHSTDAAVARR